MSDTIGQSQYNNNYGNLYITINIEWNNNTNNKFIFNNNKIKKILKEQYELLSIKQLCFNSD